MIIEFDIVSEYKNLDEKKGFSIKSTDTHEKSKTIIDFDFFKLVEFSEDKVQLNDSMIESTFLVLYDKRMNTSRSSSVVVNYEDFKKIHRQYFSDNAIVAGVKRFARKYIFKKKVVKVEDLIK